MHSEFLALKNKTIEELKKLLYVILGGTSRLVLETSWAYSWKDRLSSKDNNEINDEDKS